MSEHDYWPLSTEERRRYLPEYCFLPAFGEYRTWVGLWAPKDACEPRFVPRRAAGRLYREGGDGRELTRLADVAVCTFSKGYWVASGTRMREHFPRGASRAFIHEFPSGQCAWVREEFLELEVYNDSKSFTPCR